MDSDRISSWKDEALITTKIESYNEVNEKQLK